MTTGDEERDGRLGDVTVHETIDGHVRGEVVDAVDRAVERHREPLRRTHADEQCSDKSRTGRDRDGIHVPQRYSGFCRSPVEGRVEGFEVGPTGDLGDHPAEARLLVDTRGHRIKEQAPAADEGDAGLVA